jgi:Uncharacterized protein conserved in bacteria (DUF2252)
MEKRLAPVIERTSQHFGLADARDGGARVREKPPLIYHLSQHALPARKAFASYAETLQEDRRVLLHRDRLRDMAFKAVGVGSVETFCAIGLLTAGDCSSQAATSNSVAMNLAWALMSLPPMFRTCPFLIIAIASYPASDSRAVQKPPKPSRGQVSRFTFRWSCSTMVFRYFTCRSRDRR